MAVNRSWNDLIKELRGCTYQFGWITEESLVYRLEFDEGLNDTEIASVESRYQFRFPPDLRGFLQTALPKGPQFPDWRAGDERTIRDWMDAPKQGVLFDIEHNDFWLPRWGPRPSSSAEAIRRVEALLSTAPRLIPIFSHRMMPDEPHLPGNPVFSVHQTDIIPYGFDLTDYLRQEFQLPGREPWPEKIRPIRFWGLDPFREVHWRSDGSCVIDDCRDRLA